MADTNEDDRIHRIPVRIVAGDPETRPRPPGRGEGETPGTDAALGDEPVIVDEEDEEPLAERPAERPAEPTVARAQYVALARENLRLKEELRRLQGETYQLKAGLHGAEEKAKEQKDQVLRAQAEYQNLRRRVEREKEDLARYAHADLLLELLPVLDNFHRAMRAVNQGEIQAEFFKGIELIQKQLEGALASHELRPVEAEGQPFDPNFHEAISRAAHPRIPADHVVQAHQRGYLYKDRLLRPALVEVSAGPPEDPRTAPAAEGAATDPEEAREEAT